MLSSGYSGFLHNFMSGRDIPSPPFHHLDMTLAVAGELSPIPNHDFTTLQICPGTAPNMLLPAPVEQASLLETTISP